jgi:uroporphyrinogen decarboxylase
MVFQTIFNPFLAALQTYGNDLVMAHCKEAPKQVAKALKGMAEAEAEWAQSFIEAGASGLYYSAQFSEPGRFSKAEWEELIKPNDLMILKASEQKGGRNIVHICGEPDYQFKATPQWHADYPFIIINWSVKDTGVSLKEGKKLFGGRPIMGGMNNKGNILNGTDESIVEEVRAVINSIDIEGFMLGADCTIQGKGISHEKIKVAVDAAHAWQL